MQQNLRPEYPKNLKKTQQHHHLLTDFYQKLVDLIYVKVPLDVKFQEIMRIGFSVILIRRQFLTDTQTVAHTDIFKKQSNRVQEIPKYVILRKSGNEKFLRKLYFFLFIKRKVKKKEEKQSECCYSIVKYFPSVIYEYSVNSQLIFQLCSGKCTPMYFKIKYNNYNT